MDWLCPGYSVVLANQLQKYHGNLTADLVIHDIIPVVQSGDLHIAIYDLEQEVMYVSNAKGDGESGPDMAYDRQANHACTHTHTHMHTHKLQSKYIVMSLCLL